MASIAFTLFFTSLSFLLLFVLYKGVEYYSGREFGMTRFLASFDMTFRGLIMALSESMVSYGDRIKLFLLTRIVYPLQRTSRRTRFRVSSWYFRTLSRLRERHLARYRSTPSPYMRTVSSYKEDEEEKRRRTR